MFTPVGRRAVRANTVPPPVQQGTTLNVVRKKKLCEAAQQAVGTKTSQC